MFGQVTLPSRMPEGTLFGMTSTTTIKVPRTLRDRLAVRAREGHTTLAGALERALDESEEREFWEAVRASNAAAPGDRLASVALRDDLGDEGDDALGADGW